MATKKKYSWNAMKHLPKQKGYGRYNCTPPPYRTLLDMSEREILALEKEYDCLVVRPTKEALEAHGAA